MAFVPNIPQDYLPQQEAPMPVGATPVQTEEPLVLGEGAPVSSPQTIESRATKFKYGLGDLLQKSHDEIYQNLTDGKEDELRATAASTIDQRKRQATQTLITNAAANKQGPLTDEEKSGLVQIIQNMGQDTDPDTVLETAYGKQFIGTLDRITQANPDNVYADAQKVDPEAVAKMTNDHTDLVSKMSVIDTMIEDTKDTIKNQSYVGYGYDMAKFMIPGYQDYQLRGLTPQTGQFTGIGLGENLEEQRKELLRLPIEDMRTQMKKIVDSMQSNPQLQMEWLDAMKGQASDSILIKNWTLPIDIAGTGIGGKVGKAVARAIKGPEEVVKLAGAKRAIEDVTAAAAAPGASKSTVEAAAGDLTESAVTRATTNAVSEIKNLPDATQRGVEALTSTHRADMQAAKANPGKFGQDIVNRIEERGDQTMTNLVDTAINIQKNERLPDVLANESSVRLIVEDMKNKYKDIKNSIIDMSRIYREPLSNTYHIDFYLGNNDGTYFTQRSVAENYIANHNLGGVEVSEGYNTQFTKDVVKQRKIEKDIEGAQRIIDRETPKSTDIKFSAEERAKSLDQITTAQEYIKDKQLEQKPYKISVEQQGVGFYIKVTKPIDETRPAIRDALAQTGNTKIPDSPVAFFLNNWIGKSIGARISKYRTPEEVLSLAERQNRLTSTYAPASYFKIMVDNANDIKALQAGRFSRGRKRWEEWQRGLENAQELPDPLDPERKGYFFQSPGEMEDYWQQWFQRLPDEQEIGAYFEFKRGMEMDRVFRNLAEHRNQSRVGAETHNIVLSDAAGKEYRSPSFNGVVRQKIPGSADSITVFTDKMGEERTVALGKQSTATKKDWQKDIDSGLFKLIELYNPKLRPLSGFSNLSDEWVRYVLVPQVETRPLDWNHIPRRGGGHIQYDYDFYLKQAQIKADSATGIHRYEGDTTILASPTEGIGKRVAEHLNEVRKLIKAGNDEGAKNYSNKNLHFKWDDVNQWFKGYKDENGKFQSPRLSLNEDIHVVPNNRRVIDHDNNLRFKYSDFHDATKEGSLAAQNQIEFSQERDAFGLEAVGVEGTKANPIYKVSPANKIDPITTMNRGMARIARSNFMDDYKTMAVEHWLQQAKTWLNVKNESEIFHSPFYHFNEAKFLPNTPPDVRLRLEASRYHTQQLTGQPSIGDAWLHSIAQKLADSAFQNLGPKGMVLTPTWLLPHLKDPFALARSMAFHVKLGLFNIPQFIVQAGNYSNIYGIAGAKYASTGTVAAQLHFWSTVNSHPNIIAHLDTLASKFHIPGASNWRPGEFTEAMTEMNRTGFGNVGGEFASLDNPMSTKIVNTGFGTFLDWGTAPFKAGERNARYGAWYTAFKEFRDANPIGRLTNEDRASILQRADLLNVNMSRASSSAIHKGVWSVPTQFYTYQIRLMELMFGNRITGAERARMFATNAMLYGVPMATGLTGLPIADYLRRKALENNYTVGDDYLTSMFMEGLPSAIGAMITGKGDPKAGTWYNVGARFGTKGLEFLGSAQQMDKGWLDVAGGPAYSIAKDFYAATDGMRYVALAIAKRDPDVFPMVVEDGVDAMKEITIVNSAWRVYAATQFGRWVSKKDAYLADTSGAQAAFAAAFGVHDVAIDDINLKNNSLKIQAEYEKGVEDQFRQEFRRGVLAQKDNPDQAKRFFSRAQWMLELGGYREDRINSLVSKAISDNQSIMDKTNWDFYLRKAPDAQSQSRYEAYRKTLKIQDKKSGVE
jgi:hypothetical protein